MEIGPLPDCFQDIFAFYFIVAIGHSSASYHSAIGTIKHCFDGKDQLGLKMSPGEDALPHVSDVNWVEHLVWLPCTRCKMDQAYCQYGLCYPD
eukprot:8992646-Ditylum_brightwellii.AAC.2